MEQTLVIRHDINTGKQTKMRVVAGNCVDDINDGPSDGDCYNTGKLVTPSMRRTKWYKNGQFDSEGNSDWLI